MSISKRGITKNKQFIQRDNSSLNNVYISKEDTSITLTDSMEHKLEDVELNAVDLQQDSTTGKNVLDSSTISKTTNHGITCTYNSETQEITFNGTCDRDNTTFGFSGVKIQNITNVTTLTAYYVSGTIENYCTLRLFSSTWGGNMNMSLLSLPTDKKISVTANGGYEAVNNSFRFNEGAVANNFTLKLMVANSTDTTYEKYTNGASPNPEYPQPISVVTGEQEVVVRGKNELDLVDRDSVSNGITTNIRNETLNASGTATASWCNLSPANYRIPLVLKANKTYTFWRNQTLSTHLVMRLYYSQDTGEYINATIPQNSNKVTFTPTKDTVSCYFYIGGGLTSGQEFSISDLKLMVYEGTEWEGYIEPTTKTIHLGNLELAKISNYKDRIRKSKGKNVVSSYIALNNTTQYSDVLFVEGDLKPSTTYTISFVGVDGVDVYRNENLFTGAYNIICNGQRQSITLKTKDEISKTNTAQYNADRGWRIFKNKITQPAAPNFKNVMIQEGSIMTDYEPYGKVWYKEENIKKLVYTGASNENWSIVGTGTENWYYRIPLDIRIKSSGVLLNTNYSVAEGSIKGDTTYQGIWQLNVTTEQSQIRIRYGAEDSIANFKSYLSSHNMTHYFALETPTYTIITDETLITDLEDLKNASTCGETTIIEVNGDLAGSLNMKILSAYKRLEYIKGTGSQYINIEYIPKSNTKIIIDFENTSDSKWIIGSRTAYQSTDSIGIHWSNSNTYSIVSPASRDISTNASGRHKLELTSTEFKVDDIIKLTYSSTLVNGTYPIYIFTMNNGNTIDERIGVGNLYYCKIYEGNTLVRDLIPVVRITDNSVGLYDNITESFYENIGSGSFTGKELNITSKIDSNNILYANDFYEL